MSWLGDLLYEKLGVAINLGELSSDEEAQLLITSLLVTMARADQDATAEESAKIIEILKEEFQLTTDHAIDMFGRAFAEEHSPAGIDELIGEIAAKLELPHKERLVIMLYRVLDADHQRELSEHKLMSQILKELKIPEDVLARAYEAYLKNR